MNTPIIPGLGPKAFSLLQEKAANVPVAYQEAPGDCFVPGRFSKQQVAQKLLEQLDKSLRAPQAFAALNPSCLKLLQDTFGQEVMIIPAQNGLQQPIQVDTRLTPQRLQENPTNLQRLRDTLAVFLLASREVPVQKQLGSLRLNIHNATLAARMKPAYTPSEFQALFELCRTHGTFDVTIHPQTSLAKTSGVSAQDDAFMGRLQWVTDVVHSGELLKEAAPEAWKQALKTLEAFYLSEAPVFEKNIRNPALYHTGDPIEGVAHIFNPSTRTRASEWQDYLRLDSHGLALKAFVDNMLEGVVERQPWGFAPSEVDTGLLQVICYLAHYFQAIGYASARSAGPWEEVPFPGGLSSSVEAVRAGFESLNNLLFNPSLQPFPQLGWIRHALIETEKKLCSGLGQQPFFEAPTVLADLIQQGQTKLLENLVKRNVPAESPGYREADAALAFISSSTVKLAPTPLEDIRQHLRILGFLEQTLVRDHGMIRYAPFPMRMEDGRQFQVFDSYLGPNGSLLATENGSVLFNLPEVRQAIYRQVANTQTAIEYGAVGDPAGFITRGLLGKPGKEAQWFMVSDMAQAYGIQLEKLLQALLQGQVPLTLETQQLLTQLYRKETEYINRSYARITGEGPERLLANGRPCPGFRVPEAYQYVSALNSPQTALPGGNTPLAWATASLYRASKLFLKNLETLEQIGLM